MKRQPFDRTMADCVKDFDCGDALYAREVSDFITGKTGEVWKSIEEEGLSVDLYLSDDDDDVIGFGCLVAQEVLLDGDTDPLGHLLMIAYFGLRTKYHKRPGDDYKHYYARQIFRDLLSEARIRRSDCKMIGLYVNPANVGAIRLYSDPEFGFYKVGTFDGDDCMVADF